MDKRGFDGAGRVADQAVGARAGCRLAVGLHVMQTFDGRSKKRGGPVVQLTLQSQPGHPQEWQCSYLSASLRLQRAHGWLYAGGLEKRGARNLIRTHV